jgi:glycine oxidase
MAKIDVLGAGITGLWQALTLARRGHRVALRDPAGLPSPASASALAGAMLAPYCEGEAGHELIRALGIESRGLWLAAYPGAKRAGSLALALPRDQAEIQRFASMTTGRRLLAEPEIASLEPALAGRFSRALYFEEEAHVEPAIAMADVLRMAEEAGLARGDSAAARDANPANWIVDCRGLAARDQLKTLRAVRGERLVIETGDVTLNRPIRLLHPRIPFYLVPWSRHRFMAGATIIESDDNGPATLRSVLELAGAAYSLHPAFAEARIISLDAGLRPAFPDNLPKIVARGRRIFVNGLYRHGFLLAPILASLTADYIETGRKREGVVFEDRGEW